MTVGPEGAATSAVSACSTLAGALGLSPTVVSSGPLGFFLPLRSHLSPGGQLCQPSACPASSASPAPSGGSPAGPLQKAAVCTHLLPLTPLRPLTSHLLTSFLPGLALPLRELGLEHLGSSSEEMSTLTRGVQGAAAPHPPQGGSQGALAMLLSPAGHVPRPSVLACLCMIGDLSPLETPPPSVCPFVN